MPITTARGIFLCLAVAAAAPCAEAQDSNDSVVVFENARVIVGDGSAPIENARFVVEGGRFAAVGAADGVDAPEGADVIDLGGLTVMPALVDTHTHLSRTRNELIEDLRQRARFGVGAAASLGQDEELAFEVRGEDIPGAARLYTAGRGITTPEPGRSEIPYWITTADEGRAAVRELAEREVDIVKIWVDDRNGQYEKLSPELYRAIIDEAHRHDLKVTAHIYYLEDAKELLRAGLDAFAHGIRDTDVDDEVIALFKMRPEVVLVPNLPDPGVPVDLGWLRGRIPDETLERLEAASTERPEAQAAFGIQARNLDRLADEGVTIAMGTDGNSPWAPHLEMEDMVRAGMEPHDVIVAATRNSAALIGHDGGTIEPGRSADFIVLEGDPIEDITNTRRIVDVYLRGERIERR